MRIWTNAVFCYYCSVFVVGELQSSLKGKDGAKTLEGNDNNNTTNNKSHSLFRNDGYHSDVQQSFAVIAEDKTRRLDTTEASYITFP